MPHMHAAEKYIRKTKRNTERNSLITGQMRAAVKSVRAAISAGKMDDARTSYGTAVSRLDRAARKGVIKKNTAARTKSRLARALSASTAAAK